MRRQVISQSASEVIREMMEYEVGNGTGGGKNAYVSGYRIGGKSGTFRAAEYAPPRRRRL